MVQLVSHRGHSVYPSAAERGGIYLNTLRWPFSSPPFYAADVVPRVSFCLSEFLRAYDVEKSPFAYAVSAGTKDAHELVNCLCFNPHVQIDIRPFPCTRNIRVPVKGINGTFVS